VGTLFVGSMPPPVELNNGCGEVPLRGSEVGFLSRILLPEAAARDAVVEGI